MSTLTRSDWLRRQKADPYVKKAKAEGWRSRAAFKLAELDQRDRLLKPGSLVVDLGAAPGGWSQYVAARGGRVVAVDLLPMDPLPGVMFLQADIEGEETPSRIIELLAERRANLVISDMAPNTSGVAGPDALRSVRLVEAAVALAGQILEPGGVFLAKVLQGSGFQELVRHLRGCFDVVAVRKPEASRKESREVYVLAKGFRGAVAMADTGFVS